MPANDYCRLPITSGGGRSRGQPAITQGVAQDRVCVETRHQLCTACGQHLNGIRIDRHLYAALPSQMQCWLKGLMHPIKPVLPVLEISLNDFPLNKRSVFVCRIQSLVHHRDSRMSMVLVCETD